MQLEAIQSEADLARIENEHLRAIYGYWSDKRNGRTMPSRSDIAESEMGNWKDNAIIVKVERGPTDFYYEHFGDKIVSLFGRNAQGERLSAFSGKGADIIRQGYVATLEGKAAHHQSNFGDAQDGVYRYERVLLPLSEDGEAVDGILVLTYQMPL